MAYNRGLLEEKITNKKIANGEIANAKKIANDEVTKISVQTSSTINRWGRDVREMDAKMLYSFIRAYEHDTWKDSPEFRELTERLKKPVKWLRANGYWIPNRLEKV